jgi:hypothetical protein
VSAATFERSAPRSRASSGFRKVTWRLYTTSDGCFLAHMYSIDHNSLRPKCRGLLMVVGTRCRGCSEAKPNRTKISLAWFGWQPGRHQKITIVNERHENQNMNNITNISDSLDTEDEVLSDYPNPPHYPLSRVSWTWRVNDHVLTQLWVRLIGLLQRASATSQFQK